MLLLHQRTGQQILQKKSPQGLDRSLIKRGEKAAERRTCRQAVAPKERHECACPGLEPLVKGFQCPFRANGITEKHRDKIDHLIATDRGDEQSTCSSMAVSTPW